MNYVFVNKNKLIPKTIIFDKNELNLALQLLQKKANKKNVYIVSTYKNVNLSIIFSKNNKLYSTNGGDGNDSIKEFNNNDDIDFIKQFELDKIKILDTDIIKLIEPYSYNKCTETEGDKGCDVQRDSDDKGCDVQRDSNQLGTTDLLKEQLKKECSDIIQLYNNQKDKVNRLNRDILIMEKKERKIQQGINDKKFDSLTRLHNDLKIYDELCLEQVETPILFCKKYEYFRNTSENIKDIYNKIKSIDINKLLDEGITSETIQKYNLDELFNISNIYNTDLKKLNVSFEHSWSELDADID
jgi:hypothetical protein